MQQPLCGHVWIDQLEKLRKKDPALRSATPPLSCLSAQELKTFVAGRVKLRLRWDKDHSNFFAKGLFGIHGVCEFRLLPGGKSVIVISGCGGVMLRRIELEDSQASPPVVATTTKELSSSLGGVNCLPPCRPAQFSSTSRGTSEVFLLPCTISLTEMAG